ncbi:hypothetical protein [Paenirhodobacter sp.]|uniref:hypothetical protein n=1 Tax=Paenirhodobacter sp. TaxID=1965326 RepID=UPI003B512029
MVPELGYTRVSAIVKQAAKDGVSFVEAMVTKGLMGHERVVDLLRQAVDPGR